MPTTGGLWFQRGLYGSPGRTTKSGDPLTPGPVRCFHCRVDLTLEKLSGVLEQADYRVRAGSHAVARVWPTGFDILDLNLSGGFRSGELVLVGGPQGLGKTTWALQVARNVARSGR